MTEKDRIQELKNKLGFEKSDMDIDLEKPIKKNIPSLILPDSCKPKATERKPIDNDVQDVLDEIGLPVDNVNVRRSGLSDEELKKIQDQHPEDNKPVDPNKITDLLEKVYGTKIDQKHKCKCKMNNNMGDDLIKTTLFILSKVTSCHKFGQEIPIDALDELVKLYDMLEEQLTT